MISNFIFAFIFVLGIFLFSRKIQDIKGSIALGKDLEINDRKRDRWKTMIKVALGQSKMTSRPVAGIFHIIIYIGFIIINLEVLEIIIDGLTGNHRVFAPYLGTFYSILIGSFEFLALAVFVACVIFLIRRNLIKINRFHYAEMTRWPKWDGNIILIFEILLMGAFLFWNATDQVLQERNVSPYIEAGWFPISTFVASMFSETETTTLIFLERSFWWFHIVGILIFLNYIPYSKHFHIFLAFPNTYYSDLNPKGQFNNLESVKNEVALLLDPQSDPYATPPPADNAPIPSFGAKDVTDLTWKNLMDAFSCTECGRCSSACPANQTGKKLSPRKIMMDVRDRTEELYAFKKKNGMEHQDDRSLMDYISNEELWACTSCNACVEECPININPLQIILEMRRYLIMEESKSPESITAMFNNIENNGAPWAFSPTDRLNWSEEMN